MVMQGQGNSIYRLRVLFYLRRACGTLGKHHVEGESTSLCFVKSLSQKMGFESKGTFVTLCKNARPPKGRSSITAIAKTRWNQTSL